MRGSEGELVDVDEVLVVYSSLQAWRDTSYYLGLTAHERLD